LQEQYEKITSFWVIFEIKNKKVVDRKRVGLSWGKDSIWVNVILKLQKIF